MRPPVQDRDKHYWIGKDKMEKLPSKGGGWLKDHPKGEPLYRVHECVFAVLALESEPVDPRL